MRVLPNNILTKMRRILRLTATKIQTARRSNVNQPVEFAVNRPDQPGRRHLTDGINSVRQHLLQHRHLAGATDQKDDLPGLVQQRHGHGQSVHILFRQV